VSESERKEVARRCHELLFLLAESIAEPLPGETPSTQARQALAILKGVEQSAGITRAYHVRRARYLKRVPDPAGAAEAQRAAAKLPASTDSVLDQFLLGEECYLRHDLAGAIAHLEKTLQRDPRHFWAQYLLASCYLRTQRLGEARAALTACLNNRPDFVWALLYRGFALAELAAGREDAEVNTLLAAAEDDFRQALALPRNAEADYVLTVHRGLLRLRQNRLEDAAGEFSAAIRLRPKEFAAHVNFAQVREQQGQLDAAVRALGDAIEARPELAVLYRTRARLHLKRGDAKAALPDLERAIRLDDARRFPARLAEDHKERGSLLAAAKRHEEALTAFETALRLRPGYAVAHRLKAEVLRELRRPREALAALDRYLERVAGARAYYLSKKEPVARAYLARAALRTELGQLAGALDDYTQALELTPEAVTYALRGWAYVRLGGAALALRDFDTTLRASPNNGDARAGRGTALVLLGRTREALVEADRAVQLAPGEARTLCAAAGVYALAGVRRPSSGPATREAQEQRQYALNLLEQALNTLPDRTRRAEFWRDNVQADTALQTLQQEPRFRRLAAGFNPET
jgi:tetratricopeptide (TPR) repeat protein